MDRSRTVRGHVRGATFCLDGIWVLRGELDAAALDALGVTLALTGVLAVVAGGLVLVRRRRA